MSGSTMISFRLARASGVAVALSAITGTPEKWSVRFSTSAYAGLREEIAAHDVL